LSADQIQALRKRGIELAAHGVNRDHLGTVHGTGAVKRPREVEESQEQSKTVEPHAEADARKEEVPTTVAEGKLEDHQAKKQRVEEGVSTAAEEANTGMNEDAPATEATSEVAVASETPAVAEEAQQEAKVEEEKNNGDQVMKDETTTAEAKCDEQTTTVAENAVAEEVKEPSPVASPSEELQAAHESQKSGVMSQEVEAAA